ncbi:spindle and kinetochore-associated protein 3 isoform X2 [Syngnathoides biaculeatus]|uniref:spindle and kinetochore-associated protein 3 isoform X2 n=1 Tax=Syngnathoides biaculeatus TaxID=300417 RepID=UPI002ADD87C0|nr:spindle and kinetochore-associated protein 3 isoform X2 [Syngnathoides biaculeatus]
MDPKAEFFTKLKKLCGMVETEVAQLQQTFENRHNSGSAAKAMGAFDDLYSEALTLKVRNKAKQTKKGQLQDTLNEQKAQMKEVDAFIQACTAMQTKLIRDVRVLTEHCEKYGYQAPTDTSPLNAEGEKLADKESDETTPAENERKGQDDEELASGCSKSPVPPPPMANRAEPMRSPKMSDFGLCELELRRRFLECKEDPAVPDVGLPRQDMPTPLPPTPKFMLHMDDDKFRSPQMIDFGISEDTMFPSSDFTMDLFRKDADKRQAQNRDLPAPAPVPATATAPTPSLSEENDLVSPEPPVFFTPGLGIKRNGPCSPPPHDAAEFRSSAAKPSILPESPEVPVFQTPSLKHLLSSKKHKPLVPESGDSHVIPRLLNPLEGAIQERPHASEYKVPELCIPGVQEDLNLDGATQDFCLSTPRTMREFDEMNSPEMPDLSSVTQDICKIVLESQRSQKRAEHKNRFINVVSMQEFCSLPEFLKGTSLNNLNQAVHNINKYLAKCLAPDTCTYTMEELKKMTDMDIRAPIYMLCLTELKRLEKVEGAVNDAVYKFNLSS